MINHDVNVISLHHRDVAQIKLPPTHEQLIVKIRVAHSKNKWVRRITPDGEGSRLWFYQ